MEKEKNLMRQAYLDEALPVEDVIRFEEALSEKERQRIVAEQNLESLIVQKVSQCEPCPDELWQRIKNQIEQKAEQKQQEELTSIRQKASFKYGFLRAAVIFLVVAFSIVVLQRATTETSVLSVTFPADLESFVKSAHVQGGKEKIYSVLTQNGFDINLDNMDAMSQLTKHKIESLGISKINIKGKPAVKILFSCCNQPVVVFVLKKEHNLPHTVKVSGSDSKYYQISKKTDKYNVTAISPHNPENLLALF